jgi:hypothetical protein
MLDIYIPRSLGIIDTLNLHQASVRVRGMLVASVAKVTGSAPWSPISNGISRITVIVGSGK